MLIDNRHGGPIHIPTRADFSAYLPASPEVADALWNAATKPAEGTKLPPVLKELPHLASVVESETVEESPPRSSRASSTARFLALLCPMRTERCGRPRSSRTT